MDLRASWPNTFHMAKNAVCIPYWRESVKCSHNEQQHQSMNSRVSADGSNTLVYSLVLGMSSDTFMTLASDPLGDTFLQSPWLKRGPSVALISTEQDCCCLDSFVQWNMRKNVFSSVVVEALSMYLSGV